MRITLSFKFTRDLSDLSYGNRFLEILHYHGLLPDKAGNCEPIREGFTASDLPKYWKLQKSCDCILASFDFLFKGKEKIKFMGMISCKTGLNPDSIVVNGVTLWLTVQKDCDINKFILLGDELFVWSVATYGYITEETKNLSNIMIQKKGFQVNVGSVCDGISGLMWLNYFGKPYLAEKEFRLPAGHAPIGHGARLRLAEHPDDEILKDLDYIKKKQETIGSQWFCPYEKIENGIGYLQQGYRRSDISQPKFDRTEITRKLE